jgi:hypothetical protein
MLITTCALAVATKLNDANKVALPATNRLRFASLPAQFPILLNWSIIYVLRIVPSMKVHLEYQVLDCSVSDQ